MIYLLLILSIFIFIFQQSCYSATAFSQIKSNNLRLISRQLSAYKKINNFVNHHVKSIIKNNKLNATQDNTPVWSNAFNFNKSSGTEVDPRTGILTAHFNVGNLLSNFGHGPDIHLQVNYNSFAVSDPDGLGHGWSWNLTHFNPITDQLTTSFGQAFYLQPAGYYHWQPLYHKLKDIKIDGDKSTHFIITYANGLRETLSHEGYISLLEQQDGYTVHFLYEPGTHLLNTIVDDMGHKMTIIRKRGYWNINSYNINGQFIATRIDNRHHHINEIILPSDHHQSIFTFIHLNYTYGYLLSSVEYPSGMKKAIIYNCSDAMKFASYGQTGTKSLCVVSHESVSPGAGQPEMKMNYYYTMANNKHNYLGFNAGISSFSGIKRDSLFEAPVSYTYHTIKDNGLVKEIRTWNKYHLLINIRLISDYTGRLLSEVNSYFCRTDSPDACSHTSFSDLPLTYSLPLKIVTRVWGEDKSSPATDTQTTVYDDYGRVINHKDAYGRVTTTRYCPVKGNGVACPSISPGWFFSRLPQTVTIYPVSGSNLPVVTRHNFYRKLINLHGAGYMLVLHRQTLRANSLWTTQTRNYYESPDDVLSYGLLKTITLTGNTGLSSPLTSVVHNYRYVKSSDNYSETIYSTISLGAKKFQPLPTLTTSLFTHQKLMYSDVTGQNITRYHYDMSGYLLQTDLAVGTAFATSVHYRYTLSPQHNYIIITSANGLKSKITFDGLGRQLMSFNEAVSATGKVRQGLWQAKSKISYDAYGRVKQQASFIEGADGKTTALIITKEYDETGRELQIHLPGSKTAVTVYDDADRCMVSYLQSHSGLRSALSVIHANVLNKPVLKQIFPASKVMPANAKQLCHFKTKSVQARETHFFYDGFGRPIKVIDTMGRVVKKYYDAIGRITDIVNPKQDIIHLQYNLLGKVIARWALPEAGGRYLLYAARYNEAGQLLWKSGEDGSKSWFTYTPAGQVETITTATKHKVLLQYNSIGLPIAKYLDGHLLQKILYNPVTTLPVAKIDVTGKTTLTYSIDHLPVQLVHTGKNGYPNYHLFWKYDNNRRVISLTDISGNQTLITYDALGRNATLYYQSHVKSNREILSSPVYDGFSRIASIHYGSGMQRTIGYDDWGRGNEITDKIAGKLLMHWHFSYDMNGNIVMLTKQAENNQQAVLSYRYDTLNNLISMTCTGSEGLPLCPRDTAITGSGLQNAPIMTRQDYTFTQLNRLSQVREILQNMQTQSTLRKFTSYGYYHLKSPLRLKQISTQWNEQPAILNYFTYDIAGNMTTDGEGNHITYNAFSQITHVITSTGKQSCYIYNGSGKEVFEKNDLGTTYLFYRDKQLLNEQISSHGQATHVVGYQSVAKTRDSAVYQYYENNYKGDIISILEKAPGNNHYQLKQRNIYSPYGMCWHSLSVSQPLYQQNLIGFDGKRTDPATGWQFLGAGHRTYNPAMRYFFSEDPAGDGYAFGSNNSVMNTDPGGNTSKTVNEIFKIIGYISSLGTRAIPERWGAIVGTIISTGLMAACGGALNVTLPVLLMNSTFSGVPVAAAAVPSNKGLNIAASVVGLIQFGAFVIGNCLGLPLTLYSACCGAAANIVSAENSGVAEELAMNEMGAVGRAIRCTSTPDTFYGSENSDQNYFARNISDAGYLKYQLKERLPDLVVDNHTRPHLNIQTMVDIKYVYTNLVDIYGLEKINKEVQALLLFSYQRKSPLFIDTLSMIINNVAETGSAVEGASNYIPATGQLLKSVVVRPGSVSLPNLCSQLGDTAIIGHQDRLLLIEKAEANFWTAVQFTSEHNIRYTSAHNVIDLFYENESNDSTMLDPEIGYDVYNA